MRIKAASLEASTPPLEHRIVVEIIQQAKDDWERAAALHPNLVRETLTQNPTIALTALCNHARSAGFRSPRQELLAFWHSEWCEDLFDELSSMDYGKALKALGIPFNPGKEEGS